MRNMKAGAVGGSSHPQEPRDEVAEVVPARDRRDSRWDEHRRTRREQLVQATLDAVARHGAGVGMDEIAAEAGTSKTAVYRYFSDRTELYVAVCTRVASRLLPRLRDAVDSSQRPREMVAAAIDTYLGFIEADPELYRFVVHQQALGDRPAATRSAASPISSATRRRRSWAWPSSARGTMRGPRHRGATASSAWSARLPTGGSGPGVPCSAPNSPHT